MSFKEIKKEADKAIKKTRIMHPIVPRPIGKDSKGNPVFDQEDNKHHMKRNRQQQIMKHLEDTNTGLLHNMPADLIETSKKVLNNKKSPIEWAEDEKKEKEEKDTDYACNEAVISKNKRMIAAAEDYPEVHSDYENLSKKSSGTLKNIYKRIPKSKEYSPENPDKKEMISSILIHRHGKRNFYGYHSQRFATESAEISLDEVTAGEARKLKKEFATASKSRRDEIKKLLAKGITKPTVKKEPAVKKTDNETEVKQDKLSMSSKGLRNFAVKHAVSQLGNRHMSAFGMHVGKHFADIKSKVKTDPGHKEYDKHFAQAAIAHYMKKESTDLQEIKSTKQLKHQYVQSLLIHGVAKDAAKTYPNDKKLTGPRDAHKARALRIQKRLNQRKRTDRIINNNDL